MIYRLHSTETFSHPWQAVFALRTYLSSQEGVLTRGPGCQNTFLDQMCKKFRQTFAAVAAGGGGSGGGGSSGGGGVAGGQMFVPVSENKSQLPEPRISDLWRLIVWKLKSLLAARNALGLNFRVEGVGTAQRARSCFSQSSTGFDSWRSQKFIQCHRALSTTLLRGSGQRLYNVDQTHIITNLELKLAYCKSTSPSKAFKLSPDWAWDFQSDYQAWFEPSIFIYINSVKADLGPKISLQSFPSFWSWATLSMDLFRTHVIFRPRPLGSNSGPFHFRCL